MPAWHVLPCRRHVTCVGTHRSGLRIASRHLDQVHGGAAIGLHDRVEAPDLLQRSRYLRVLDVPVGW